MNRISRDDKRTTKYTRSFSLEKDGFVGELYTGARCPGKAILYVGGAGCKKNMTIMSSIRNRLSFEPLEGILSCFFAPSCQI